MGKTLFLVCLFVLVTFTCAQQSMAQTDYRRFEFFVGYSHNRVDVGPVEDFDPEDDLEFDDIFDEREGFNGVNLAVVGNFHRYFGAKFDYSYHQKSFDFGPDNTTVRLHNFLGGIQVKDNSTDATVKPFAHALVGVGRTAADLSEFDNRLVDFDDAGFAAAIGGGIDLRLSSRIDLRAIQIDYNPMRFDFTDFGRVGIPGTPTPTGDAKRTLHNFRIGIGIVIRN
ncbi:MAG TPA: outer membrane beta-barrel protein [Pyrinomonadaceae bacterium]|nr:outer membrane beta-barrel protein [Pyrinomonadaceae bacterium]